MLVLFENAIVYTCDYEQLIKIKHFQMNGSQIFIVYLVVLENCTHAC